LEAASGQLRWDLGLPDATDEQPRSAEACQDVEKSYCEPKTVSLILTIGSTLNEPYNELSFEIDVRFVLNTCRRKSLSTCGLSLPKQMVAPMNL
jgi:hypothetical protein